MNGGELLSTQVNRAIRGMRVDTPDGWLALCQPEPCTALHDLGEVAPSHGEVPVFVLQLRKDPTPDSSIGVVACGCSRLGATGESMPLIERLTPKLAVMTLQVIVTADLPATVKEICRRRDVPCDDALNVPLPVDVTDNALHVDVDKVPADEVDLALLCFTKWY